MEYSPYMEYSPAPQARRERQERREQEHLTQLLQRWKLLPFPLQSLLGEHLKHYGCDAAWRMTEIVERTITIYGEEEEVRRISEATSLTTGNETSSWFQTGSS